MFFLISDLAGLERLSRKLRDVGQQAREKSAVIGGTIIMVFALIASLYILHSKDFSAYWLDGLYLLSLAIIGIYILYRQLTLITFIRDYPDGPIRTSMISARFAKLKNQVTDDTGSRLDPKRLNPILLKFRLSIISNFMVAMLIPVLLMVFPFIGLGGHITLLRGLYPVLICELLWYFHTIEAIKLLALMACPADQA